MTDTHPFAELDGTWRGSGAGEYPTIADFAYTEELTVAAVPGRPLARWASTTRDAASGEPRHAESGFLRATDAGIELVVAHGFGIAEASAGTLQAGRLELASTRVARSPTAKPVDSVVRLYEFAGDRLHYTIAMAAVGVPVTHHLRADLRRS